MLQIDELSKEIRRARVINNVFRWAILFMMAVAVVGYASVWAIYQPGCDGQDR